MTETETYLGGDAETGAPDSPAESGMTQQTDSSITLDANEDIASVEREELEDKYLDLKDELWRLRRQLNLDPGTGKIPNNGGYASPGGFLKRQRVAVFVDVQNMYHSAKKTYGRNLSYSRMLRACVRNRRLVRSTAYVIEREGIDQVSW